MSRDRLNDIVRKNVIAAFQSIHKLGVVQGDVRRENVLVGDDNAVMIVDFEASEFEEFLEAVVIMEDESVEKMLRDLGEMTNGVNEGKEIGDEVGF